MKSPRLLTNKNIALKKTKHGHLMYPIKDLFIGRSLDLYGEWGETELSYLGRLLNPGDYVVDVGAFIGTHTIYFAKKVGPKGFVHAIEPTRLIFHLLAGNVALNSLPNVQCFNLALDATPNTYQLPTPNFAAKQNMGGASLLEANQGEPVTAITLDALNLNRCNLIKIDVEGMEIPVLKGASSTIQKFRPLLFVENNTEKRSSSILKYLKKINYTCFWHIASLFNKNNFFNNSKNVFTGLQPEANLLCFPSEKTIPKTKLTPVTNTADNWKKALTRIFHTNDQAKDLFP